MLISTQTTQLVTTPVAGGQLTLLRRLRRANAGEFTYLSRFLHDAFLDNRHIIGHSEVLECGTQPRSQMRSPFHYHMSHRGRLCDPSASTMPLVLDDGLMGIVGGGFP